MVYVVLTLVACAVISAALVRNTGRKAWEGALMGLVFGPMGLVVALAMAFTYKPATTR